MATETKEPETREQVRARLEAESEAAKAESYVGDFPGDDAYIPGLFTNEPVLTINKNADEFELVSGAISRLENMMQLYWLILNRMDKEDDLADGGLQIMGRLCKEAKAMCEVTMHRMAQGQALKHRKRKPL